MNDKHIRRVLQVNIDDAGGAFALVYQVQKRVFRSCIFDYYTIDMFRHDDIVNDIRNMGGMIFEERLRNNRLVGFVKLPFRFYTFLKNNKYEVIHIHSDKSWKLLLYVVSAKAAKVKHIIVHSHSSGINGDYKLFTYIAHIIGKCIIPLMDLQLISCSSEATKWMFKKSIQQKAYLIKNGVDIERFRFSEERRIMSRRAIGIKDDEVLIGTVGDFSYSKNPERLIKYFYDLSNTDQNRRYKLLFVGEGENKNNCMDMVLGLKIQDDVIFYGHTLRTEEIYDAMDVFTMTSRFEGLPVSAVEAQASGLKCLLSDAISKDTKILEDCEFFSNESQWMKSVTGYKSKVNERSERAEYVKRKGFDIGHTAEQFLSLYNECFSVGKGVTV